MKRLLSGLLGILLLASSCTKTIQSGIIYISGDSGQTVNYLVDSILHIITMFPVPGDNSPNVQSAISYNNTHSGGYKIEAAPGNYDLYERLHGVNIINGVYHQFFVDLEGFVGAQDAPSNVTTNFICHFNVGYGMCIQQGKGCVVKNIAWTGAYTLPNLLSIVQIDTLQFAQWNDGVSGFNETSPYAGVAIDPFSDPAYYDGKTNIMYPGDSAYYLPGMSISGSTDITISDCSFKNFTVGVVVSPSWQQNGDLINLDHLQTTQCASGVAFCQAQSKQCNVNVLQAWGQMNTVIDGWHWGPHKGDGQTCPNVTGTSVAGNTFQVFAIETDAYPAVMSNVFAENIHRLGMVVGDAGVTFIGFQIDYQVALAGVPSPEFYYYGFFTTWIGCMNRVYDASHGAQNDRIVLNGQGNTFQGGIVSAPAICVNQEAIAQQVQPGNYPTAFTNVFAYYCNHPINTNTYDSIVQLGTCTMNVNTSNFTGYFITKNASSVDSGETILAHKAYAEFNYGSYEYPAGFVTGVHGDTVYLRNTGKYIYTGNSLALSDAKLKAKY